MLQKIKLISLLERVNTVKIKKSLVLGFVSISMLGIIMFKVQDWPAASNIAGIVLGLLLPELLASLQDLVDTTEWKVSQRKLERGGFIKKDKIGRAHV